jgi:Tfp pilus assembly protein PilF/ketosteroid isomerase-like protein
MTFKSIVRILAIALLIGAFATLIKIPSNNDSAAPPKTELQKMLADKQFDAALKSANEAIRLNPQDFGALLAKGIALTAQNQRQEAISLYQKMIKEFPESTEPYNNLAALYAADGKYENARLALEKAMQTQGSYAVAYKNLNTVYTKLADQAYNKALEAGTEKSEQTLQLNLLTEQGQPGKQAFVVSMSQFDQYKSSPSKKPVQVARAPIEEPLPSTPPPVIVAQAPTPSASTATSAKEIKPEKATIAVSVISTEGKDSRGSDSKSGKPALSSLQESAVKSDKSGKSLDKAEREVIDAVQAWAVAWSKQDIKAYLAHYASNFDPGNQSRSAWESDRRARIGGKARISVSVSDFSVTLKSATTASVKFRQSYRSDRLNSQTGKTLVMERKGDGWRIVQEKAGG